MIECVARLLRFADELEEGEDPRASLVRYGVEAVLTLAGSIDRDASMAGHEGPSSADADELRHQGEKVIQFACALGFDPVEEPCDSEEITTSATPAAHTRRRRKREVPAANGRSSKKPKCGGRNPWAVKLKKPIIHDTEEKLTLAELVTDLNLGVAAGYDGRQMSDELNELVAEYAQSKADRPVEEQSLFALIGQDGAQTTEQRLSVVMMKGKPELGGFVGDIEQSAQEGLTNKFHVKLMSGPKATLATGPYGPDEWHIPKENGRMIVQGPMARGEQVRVVHGVKGGDVESLTLVADYRTTRIDGQATTLVDRDSARQSVADRAESRMPPIGATHNPFTDSLVLSDTAPRTTGSRRATEANNAMVWDGSAGKWVKAASLKAIATLREETLKHAAHQRTIDSGRTPLRGNVNYTAKERGAEKSTNERKGEGGINSGPGVNQTGKPHNSGAGAASRDYSAEGAGDRYFGLHLAIPTGNLGGELAHLVQEDGILIEPLPLCHIPVNPPYRGLTKGIGRFGLDSQGRVVGGVHCSNKPNVCVTGMTIPVTTKEAPFKLDKLFF
eukprot:g16462.t1